MPTQKDAGRAFEFALITQANAILSAAGYITELTEDGNYCSTRNSFDLFPANERAKYQSAAHAAINHIIELEPKLSHASMVLDVLNLSIVPDVAGQHGDVRDILFIRSRQGWEIGISAKNNHKAVKHSRLSVIKDFGADWLGVNCSSGYFASIAPTFQRLQEMKNEGVLWRNVQNKQRLVYVPVLDAFRDELMKINQHHNNIPQTLVQYLLGINDFYKIIKKARGVEILGFNINNTLNLNNQGRPLRDVRRLVLPTEIIQFEYKPESMNTLLMVCNEGWQISFRIHSAETLVVPSLKFDINLIGHPQTLYSHHIAY